MNWTAYHNVIPLTESMNLENYRERFLQIPQHHYAGANDKIILPEMVQKFIQNSSLVTIVPNASHNAGWQQIYPLIWAEK